MLSVFVRDVGPAEDHTERTRLSECSQVGRDFGGPILSKSTSRHRLRQLSVVAPRTQEFSAFAERWKGPSRGIEKEDSTREVLRDLWRHGASAVHQFARNSARSCLTRVGII